MTHLPKGFHSITPFLFVRDAAAAIRFYEKAFAAVEKTRLTMPDGKIAYAEIRIANAPIMLSDEFPEMGAISPTSLEGSPVVIHLYTDDVDAFVNKAVEAGATLLRPVADQFFGERTARLVDPYGHIWNVATVIESLSPAEIQKRFATFFPKEA